MKLSTDNQKNGNYAAVLLIILIIIGAFVPAPALSETSISNILTDKQYWVNNDWMDDADKLWSTQKLKVYEGRQDFEGMIIDYKEDISLNEITLQLMLRRFKDDRSFPKQVFLRKLYIDPKDCDKILDWLKNFGEPKVAFDLSHTMKTDDEIELGEFVQKQAQWLIGVTHIDFSCSGMFSNKNKEVPLAFLII